MTEWLTAVNKKYIFKSDPICFILLMVTIIYTVIKELNSLAWTSVPQDSLITIYPEDTIVNPGDGAQEIAFS